MICMGSRGLWSNDGMLQIKMCATNSKTRMLCTNHKRCSTEDLWNHNFPFCFWVMAKTISFQNIMIITLKLSYYISGLFYFSSAWILNLWTKRLFLSHSLWLLNARNFEFKLMFVSDIIKFPQGISEISHSQEWEWWTAAIGVICVFCSHLCSTATTSDDKGKGTKDRSQVPLTIYYQNPSWLLPSLHHIWRDHCYLFQYLIQ